MANKIPTACLKRLGASNEYRYIPLQHDKVIIGRAKEVTYNIADIRISRIHAVFKYTGSQWTVESVGMNGVLLNQEVVPQNKPMVISNMDIIELGVGSKFMYSFREEATEACEPVAKRIKTNLQNFGNDQTVRDAKAFQSWVQSKKNLERALVEESENLEHKLIQHSSLEDHLVSEKEKTVFEANRLVLELKSQFHVEKTALEERLAKGEMENKELQGLKDLLEKKMSEKLQEVTAKCSQKTQELEEELSKAKSEKQSLMEQKEVIVQQLQRENAILEERLNKERRVNAEAVNELSKLRECREDLEKKLLEERRKFEEERMNLLQQGNEAVSRLRQLEQEKIRHQPELSNQFEFQTRHQGTCQTEMTVTVPAQICDDDVITIAGTSNTCSSSSNFSSAEAELERVRRELQASLEEKEIMQQQLEGAASKARMDAVGKLENVVENELECSICSELFVMATSLSCAHVFCLYCIDSWKRTRNECPICRAPINSTSRSIVIDNAIDGIVATLSEDVQRRRKELIQQRSLLAQNSEPENPLPSGQQTVGPGSNRGRRRGRNQ